MPPPWAGSDLPSVQLDPDGGVPQLQFAVAEWPQVKVPQAAPWPVALQSVTPGGHTQKLFALQVVPVGQGSVLQSRAQVPAVAEPEPPMQLKRGAQLVPAGPPQGWQMPAELAEPQSQ